MFGVYNDEWQQLAHYGGGWTFGSIYVIKNNVLWAWGTNAGYQLGDGTNVSKSVPISVLTSNKFIKVGGGYQSAVGIRKNDGRLFAWGDNTYGQLGDNSRTIRTSPISISITDSFIDVVGGTNYFIALRSDGRLFSWGNNAIYFLGNNSTASRSVPGSVSTADSFVKVGTYWQHTVALRSDGKMYAWGNNNTGQCGDNSTTDRAVPGFSKYN